MLEKAACAIMLRCQVVEKYLIQFFNIFLTSYVRLSLNLNLFAFLPSSKTLASTLAPNIKAVSFSSFQLVWFDMIDFNIDVRNECLYIFSKRMQSKNNILRNSKSLFQAIIICLNQLLSQCTREDDSVSIFNLRAAPTISISDYLARMFKYMNCSLSTFVYALVLIDRIQQYNPHFILHKKNIHRLLLTANVISAKYVDDFFYKNSFYANVGGITVKVLNQLQLDFLKLINFNAHVEEETLLSYVERLEMFGDINTSQRREKENLQIEKNIFPRKKELKNKDSNVFEGTRKASSPNQKDKIKSEDTMRTNAQQL